jgi:hypothetical protein
MSKKNQGKKQRKKTQGKKTKLKQIFALVFFHFPW